MRAQKISKSSLFSIISLATVGLVASQGSEGTKQSELLSLSCLVYDDLSFYDLRNLNSPDKDYSYTNPTGSKSSSTYYFNLC